MGPLPRPAGVCEGSEMRLTRRVLSPIIFSLSCFRRRAHKICRSTGWKNRKPICCPPTGTPAKRGPTAFTERIAFSNFQTPFWRSLSAEVHNRIHSGRTKNGVLLPMVNFNIRPLGGIENKEVKNQFLLLARQTILFKDGRTLASKFATPQSVVDFCKSSPDAVRPTGIVSGRNPPARREGGTADRRRPPGRPGRE